MPKSEYTKRIEAIERMEASLLQQGRLLGFTNQMLNMLVPLNNTRVKCGLRRYSSLTDFFETKESESHVRKNKDFDFSSADCPKCGGAGIFDDHVNTDYGINNASSYQCEQCQTWFLVRR